MIAPGSRDSGWVIRMAFACTNEMNFEGALESYYPIRTLKRFHASIRLGQTGSGSVVRVSYFVLIELGKNHPFLYITCQASWR